MSERRIMTDDGLAAYAKEQGSHAQSRWAGAPIGQRLRVVRRFRRRLADQAGHMAALSAAVRDCSVAEVLASELFPLLEACRFLESDARRLLACRRLGRRGRPRWLAGVEAEVSRAPRGLVLVVGPSNYPLFLPGVHILQALVAGNRVVFKPGRGASKVALALAGLLVESGLDSRLFEVRGEAVEEVSRALNGGVDHVVLTGSVTTGREVLSHCVQHLVSSTMELGGCDVVIVAPDADLDLVGGCLEFGLRLNGGRTCIAPRVVLVPSKLSTELEGRLAERTAGLPGRVLGEDSRLRDLIEEALAAGGHWVAGKILPGGAIEGPVVLAGVPASCRICREDLMAPVLVIVTVESEQEAIAVARSSPYALGASVFSGAPERGRRLAAGLDAGVVVINDLIVPTADPRVPFGGRRLSGFGVTRGAEGLLEMTVPRVVLARRGRFRPHLSAEREGEAELLEALARGLHGGQGAWRAWVKVLRRMLARPAKGQVHIQE